MDTWNCSCKEFNTHPMTKYACYRCFDRRDDVVREQQAAEAAEIIEAWGDPIVQFPHSTMIDVTDKFNCGSKVSASPEWVRRHL